MTFYSTTVLISPYVVDILCQRQVRFSTKVFSCAQLSLLAEFRKRQSYVKPRIVIVSKEPFHQGFLLYSEVEILQARPRELKVSLYVVDTYANA